MPIQNAAVALVVQKLKNAYARHGFDVGNYAFQLELRNRFGDSAEAIARFFDGSEDLPLGTVLHLCATIGICPSMILGDGEREHLQIYDYLGGNPAHVMLPRGLLFERSLLSDSLFYLTAEGDLCEGIGAGDLLIMTRLTLDPQPGQTFLIESDSALMLRVCIQSSGGFHRFTRHPDRFDDGLVTLPLGKQTSPDKSQDRPTLTGRLAWRIEARIDR
jgi:hypothetical protein